MLLPGAPQIPSQGLFGPRESLGAPVRKPFLNLRETPLRVRMRPVPVVFLRLAFSLQLSVECHVSYPHHQDFDDAKEDGTYTFASSPRDIHSPHTYASECAWSGDLEFE